MSEDSDTIPFRAGVDLALDLANAEGGKVTSLRVSDVSPGVVDLHVDIAVTRPLECEHIDVRLFVDDEQFRDENEETE